MLATTGLKNHENISDDKEGVVKENSSKWKFKKNVLCTLYAIINHGNEMELTQACKVYN